MKNGSKSARIARPTRQFYKGDVKRNKFLIELDPSEISRQQPRPTFRWFIVSRGARDHRQRVSWRQGHDRILRSRWLISELCFPLYGKCCSERPGAVKGAPVGAALRTSRKRAGDHKELISVVSKVIIAFMPFSRARSYTRNVPWLKGLGQHIMILQVHHKTRSQSQMPISLRKVEP